MTQETSLTQALNSQKNEAFNLDRKGVEYQALEREAVSARQVFDSLLQHAKEATLVSDLQRSSVRLINPAEPGGTPVRPRKGQGLAAAAIMGVLGAFGAAFGRDGAFRRKVGLAG